MRRYNNHKTWFISILLLILSPGCCNTGSNSDLTPPTVTTSVAPLSGAVGVCPDSVVTVTFGEAMSPSTINTTTFTLTAGTPPVAVAGVVAYNASNDTATFTPTSPLALNTLYTATITTGAENSFGIALASNFVWSFTTSATPCIPPTVVSTAPPNLATGVCPSSVVNVTFSEAMNPATINTTTFTLTAGTPPVAVAGVVTFAASTATFTPSSALALSTLYTATITTGAQNTSGEALASNYSWDFTTGNTACPPPTVVSVAPPNLATGICPNTPVVATFSEDMLASTINTTTFTLTAGTPPVAVAGVVAYNVASHTATFTPSSALALSTLYTATITTGAQSLGGDPLATNYVWTFTTAAVACQATVPLGSACNFGALGGSTVTNAGPSNVTGDVGVWSGSSITGFPPGTITGSFYADDAVAQTAQADLTAAYNFAAAAPGGQVLPANIGGETLAPGVYKTTSAQPSLGITGNLTLAGNGIYIFQIVSTLTTAATNSDVILSGGATDEDVFWQVGSSATLGTSTTFAGTIMAQASVSIDTGATLNGRALARTGGVTLLSDQVNIPPCPSTGLRQ
jgi:Ice-binding-like/Bacterial Ig-like domain